METTRVQMPADSPVANYTFRVEGSVNDYSQGRIFLNETDVMFEARHVSIFIKTDKYIYTRRQWSKTLVTQKISKHSSHWHHAYFVTQAR